MREIANVYFMYSEHIYNLTHFEAWSSNTVIDTFVGNVFKIFIEFSVFDLVYDS